jgi:hypothetical protein
VAFQVTPLAGADWPQLAVWVAGISAGELKCDIAAEVYKQPRFNGVAPTVHHQEQQYNLRDMLDEDRFEAVAELVTPGGNQPQRLVDWPGPHFGYFAGVAMTDGSFVARADGSSIASYSHQCQLADIGLALRSSVLLLGALGYAR